MYKTGDKRYGFQIRLKARAKINLGLDVLGKRENGYHDVRMVMQTVGIYDRLIITKIPEDEIRININLKFLPVNENNLIYKAYKLMKDEYRFSGGIDVDLNKFIPIAAGMAGGSTDAASTMFAINRLFELGLSNEELMKQGVKIGCRCSILHYERNSTCRRNRREAYKAFTYATLPYSGCQATYQCFNKNGV